jgi:hypothetical protein
MNFAMKPKINLPRLKCWNEDHVHSLRYGGVFIGLLFSIEPLYYDLCVVWLHQRTNIIKIHLKTT